MPIESWDQVAWASVIRVTFHASLVLARGRYRHSVTKITLKPENPEFQPIELTMDDEGALKVIAEFVEVVG